MQLTIKNYRGRNTDDGYSFTATVDVDGKRAFIVENTGTGGEDMHRALSPRGAELMAQVEVEAIANGSTLDNVVADALLAWEQADHRRKVVAKQGRDRKAMLLFKLPADPADTWRTLGTLNVRLATNQLNAKYGPACWEFV